MNKLDSLRWMAGCLFCLPALFGTVESRAAEVASDVFVEEIRLPDSNLSGEILGAVEVVKTLDERELPADVKEPAADERGLSGGAQKRVGEEQGATALVKATPRFVPARESLVPLATARELLETDEGELERAALIFRTMVSQSTVRDSSRIALQKPLNNRRPEKPLVAGRFDAKKVYSFDSSGRMVEVIPSEVVAKRDQKKIEGNGWTVLAVNDENGGAKIGNAPSLQAKIDTKFEVPLSSGLFSADGIATAGDMSIAQNASASRGGNLFNIEPEMLPAELRLVGGNSVSGSAEPANSLARLAIRGKVLLPVGVSQGDIRVRVGGTDIEVIPDNAGLFEIPEIPRGSKFELLVWDVSGKLVRRLMPVSAFEAGREFEIPMALSTSVETIAESFGVQQDLMASGFCGRVSALDASLVDGAHVQVLSRRRSSEARYYSVNGFPSAAQRDLSTDGRVCAFNLEPGLHDVEVKLANGTRRLFSIHTKASSFENDVDFDMVGAVYRPVVASELVDFDEAINSASRSATMVFGTPGMRNWYDGSRAATWTGVTAFSATGDKAYAGMSYEGKSGEWALFQRAEELVEVRAGKTPDELSVFVLVGRDELRSPGMQPVVVSNGEGKVFRDLSHAMKLRLLPLEALDEMTRVTGLERNAELGAAFVDIDLVSLGLSYPETRVAVRDAWTGGYVGKISYVAPQGGVASPRYLRVWVTDLPLGQQTLVVSGKSGALHALQILRSRPGDFQIVTVGE
jgi:hypothetical protein